MISNTTCCCRQSLNYCNPNEMLYVKVINACPYYVYMFLNYKFNGKKISKQSPVFAPGKSNSLTFPSDSLSIVLRVFNCEQKPPGILYTKSLVNYRPSCFKIEGPGLGHITLVEIPC